MSHVCWSLLQHFFCMPLCWCSFFFKVVDVVGVWLVAFMSVEVPDFLRTCTNVEKVTKPALLEHIHVSVCALQSFNIFGW